ncbi:kinase-like protein, partial [Setomelanomma holmii]
CIVLRFSDGAKTAHGVVGGCGANVDLAFPSMAGISAFHLAFTFDMKNRPIIRDLGSKGGTKVTYSGEKAERMSTFDWPLLGLSNTDKCPILDITPLVQFQVILSPCDIESRDYIEKVEKFRRGTAGPETLFPSLKVQSTQSTQLPTGQQTPTKGSGNRTVLIKKEIGSGAFGTVTYIWDGEAEYVVKQPREDLNKYSKNVWKREAEILQSISHAHIVKFLGADFSSQPQIKLEYIPGGSLDAQGVLRGYSNLESTQILCDLSSALEYLHTRQPPIAHRDIKPENILVVKRDQDGILVKFSDFGFSKAADILRTFCGTPLWAAPEIYLKAADPKGTDQDAYGVQIDIYSLGVVVAWAECGLPAYEDEWNMDWIYKVPEHVAEHAEAKESELLFFIRDNMLEEDPDVRSSAKYCHTEACKLL